MIKMTVDRINELGEKYRTCILDMISKNLFTANSTSHIDSLTPYEMAVFYHTYKTLYDLANRRSENPTKNLPEKVMEDCEKDGVKISELDVYLALNFMKRTDLFLGILPEVTSCPKK